MKTEVKKNMANTCVVQEKCRKRKVLETQNQRKIKRKSLWVREKNV
jgi:hypothetical protein